MISAPWLSPLLPLFEVSAQLTTAAPALLMSTWKKSARLRSPPVVQPMPMVQIPPLWLGWSDTATGALKDAALPLALSDCDRYGNQLPVCLPESQVLGVVGQLGLLVPYHTTSIA